MGTTLVINIYYFSTDSHIKSSHYNAMYCRFMSLPDGQKNHIPKIINFLKNYR